MDWTQDTLGYTIIGALTTAFLSAMFFYVRSAQLEPEQPISDGSLQNKRKIRKKEKAREKRSTKNITIISSNDSSNNSSDDTVSSNDPLGLGIDPLYAPKSTKKNKNHHHHHHHKSNAQQAPKKSGVSEAAATVAIVSNDDVESKTVTKTVIDVMPAASQNDVVDSGTGAVPVVFEEESLAAPKDSSTDSGIRSDVHEPVIPSFAPIVDSVPISSTNQQKPKKSQSKNKNKADNVKATKKHSIKAEPDVVTVPAPEPEEEQWGFVDLPIPIESIQASTVDEESIAYGSKAFFSAGNADAAAASATQQSVDNKANKKKTKKNRHNSESGQNLLENVLELIDQGFYSTDTVQCLITALTDYGQSGAKDAWTKLNDPEEKYHKRLNQLEQLAEQNAAHMKNQDDIITDLRNDLRKHEQSEKRLNAARKELDVAISLRKTAESEINALTDKLKKIRLENDKYLEEQTLALNKARNDLAQRESELEEMNARYRQIEINHKNDLDKVFMELEMKRNQEIAVIQSNFEAEKSLLHQEKDKELQHLSIQLAASNDRIAEMNDIVSSERSHLNAEIESLKRQCTALSTQNSQLDAQLAKATQSDSSLQNELKELQNVLKTQKDDFSKKIAEKDTIINGLETRFEKMKNDFEENKDYVSKLERQIEGADRIMADFEFTNADLKDLTDKLNQDLQEANDAKADIYDQLKKATADHDALVKQHKQEVNRLESSLKNQKDELSALQKKCSDLEKQLSQKQTKAQTSMPSPVSNDENVQKQQIDLETRNAFLSKKLEESLRSNFELTNQIKKLNSNPPTPVPSSSPVPPPTVVPAAGGDEQQSKLSQSIDSMSVRVQTVSNEITKIREQVSRYLSAHSPVPEVPAPNMSGDNASSEKELELMSQRAASISNSIDLITKMLEKSMPGKVPSNGHVSGPKNGTTNNNDQSIIEENESLRNEVAELKNTVNKLHTVVQMNKHSSYLDQQSQSGDAPQSSNTGNNKKNLKKKNNNHSKMNGNNQQKALDINGN